MESKIKEYQLIITKYEKEIRILKESNRDEIANVTKKYKLRISELESQMSTYITTIETKSKTYDKDIAILNATIRSQEVSLKSLDRRIIEKEQIIAEY